MSDQFSVLGLATLLYNCMSTHPASILTCCGAPQEDEDTDKTRTLLHGERTVLPGALSDYRQYTVHS